MSFAYSENLNLLVNLDPPYYANDYSNEFRMSNKILFNAIPEEGVRV